MKCRVLGILAAVLVGPAIVAASCDSTPIVASVFVPSGQVVLFLSGPPSSGACGNPGPNAYLPVALWAEPWAASKKTMAAFDSNFLLRPPGTCAGITNCGSVRISGPGIVTTDAATPTVLLHFVPGTENYADPFDITAQLLDDNRNPWIQPADAGAGLGGKPVIATLQASCGEGFGADASTGTDGSVADDAAADAATADGSVTDGATTDGAAVDGAVTDGAAGDASDDGGSDAAAVTDADAPDAVSDAGDGASDAGDAASDAGDAGAPDAG